MEEERVFRQEARAVCIQTRRIETEENGITGANVTYAQTRVCAIAVTLDADMCFCLFADC